MILQVWVLDKLLNSSKCQFASLKMHIYIYSLFVCFVILLGRLDEELNLKDSLASDIYLVL